MSFQRPQPGSLFELEFPQSVGLYNSYADAQKAVDYLADEKFPVQNLAIVGTELKSVERVLGRRSWRTVLSSGVSSGISTGLLVGLVMLIFTRPASVLVLLLSFYAVVSAGANAKLTARVSVLRRRSVTAGISVRIGSKNPSTIVRTASGSGSPRVCR